MDNFNQFDSTESGGASKGSKKKTTLIIIVSVILLIIIVFGGLYLFNPVFKNSVKMTFMSDKDYYLSVQNDRATSASLAFNTLNAVLKETPDTVSEDLSAEYDGSIIIDKSAMENIEISKELKLSYKGNSIVKDGSIQSYNELTLGNSKFFDSNLWFDKENDVMYLNLPLYNEQLIKIENVQKDLDDLEENYSDMPSLNANNVSNFKGFDITDEQFKDVVDKYNNIFTKYTSDVTIEKNIPVTKGNVEQKLNVATVTLDGEEGLNLLNEIMSTLKDDKDVIAMLQQIGVDEEDFTNEIDVLLNYLDYAQNGIKSFTIVTYINNQGIIVGRSISLKNPADEDILKFEYCALKNKNNYNLSVCVSTYDYETQEISLVFDGSYSNNKLNGLFTMNSSSSSSELNNICVEFKDFSTKKDAVSGDMNISMDYNNYDGTSSKIEVLSNFKTENDVKSVNSKVSIDADTFMTFTLNYKNLKKQDITYPDNMADAITFSEDADFSPYFANFNTEPLTSSVMSEFSDVYSEDELNEFCNGVEYIISILADSSNY